MTPDCLQVLFDSWKFYDVNFKSMTGLDIAAHGPAPETPLVLLFGQNAEKRLPIEKDGMHGHRCKMPHMHVVQIKRAFKVLNDHIHFIWYSQYGWNPAQIRQSILTHNYDSSHSAETNSHSDPQKGPEKD